MFPQPPTPRAEQVCLIATPSAQVGLRGEAGQAQDFNLPQPTTDTTWSGHPQPLSSPTPVWTSDPTGHGLVQKTQLQLRGSSLGPPAPPPRGIWRGHKPAYWPGWGVVIRRRCRPRCPAWAAPGQQVPVPLQGQLWAWGGAAGVQGPVTTPCWQPADGSRISRVNGWAPASRLRFQGCWKASGVGQGNVCFGLQGQEGARARRRQAKLSAARGKALSALGGVWTGAAYLGTAAWPVGTLRLWVSQQL